MPELISSENEKQNMTLEQAARYLDRAGVPKGLQWRVLLLYMRGLADYNYLDHDQKYEIQNLLLELLKEKDFSEQVYQDLLEKKGEILFKPYKQKLKKAYKEISDLLQTFQKLYMSRKGDVQGLEKDTIEILEDEDDFEKALPKIKSSFQQVIKGMEDDVKDLYRQTRLDPLTNLYNRKGFEELLVQYILQAIQNKTEVSLAMLDIDHFKVLNDKYGHRIGDQALATVAKIIREYGQEVVKKKANCFYAARYGGEEFTIIFPDTPIAQAVQQVEKIREKIEKYCFVIRNLQGEILYTGIKLTISGGVAVFRNESTIDDPGTWLTEQADKAMYRAKNKGRNMVSV